MAVDDLSDRINWKQACRLLGISKSTLYRLVADKVVKAYGLQQACRFYLRSELLVLLEDSPSLQDRTEDRR